MEWDSLADIQHAPNIDDLTVGSFGIFPPDDVVSLSISSHYENDDTLFRLSARKIGQLPALNALFLRDISSMTFLLELNSDVSKEDDPSTATYPALQYLDFTNLQIDVPILTILHVYLDQRSEHGLGPRKLKVDLCGLGTVNKKATPIALLEKFVEVVWVMDVGILMSPQTRTCWFINVYNPLLFASCLSFEKNARLVPPIRLEISSRLYAYISFDTLASLGICLAIGSRLYTYTPFDTLASLAQKINCYSGCFVS